MKKITLFIALLSGGASINAQQEITNNGSLQIHTGATLASFGNFTNAASGTLVNNGSLHAKGNVINNQASMAAGTGTLYLNGSTAQAVNGTNPFKTFNLVSNNSTGITLNTNLSVSGTHTFTNGKITTSSTPTYLIYEAGSSYSGSSDASHVNGWVKKIGSTNFVFPTGNGTVLRTISLNSLSASSEFNIKYFRQITPNSYQLQWPVKDVNEEEYWSIGKPSGGTATVTMNWDNSKVFFPNWIVPDILVTGWTGSVWTNYGGTAVGAAATSGTITSDPISSFSLFALGSRSYVLASKLISFTAERQTNYTQIDWSSANENNMAGYVVERSDDGVTFYSIGYLSARNSGNTEGYYIHDYSPIHGMAYYRLRSKEQNNQEELSKLVTVKEDANTALTLLTNPVQDKLILVAKSSLNGNFTYRVVTTGGQSIRNGKLIIHNGGSYQIELTGVRPGYYTLEVNGMENFSYKVIVQ